MDAHLNTKRILIFLAIAFGISCTVTLVTYLSGAMKANPILAGNLANYIVVMSPALANVATRLITREDWGHLWLRPNFRRGWRFYLAAWLLPLLAISVGGAIFYLLFPQSFDPNLGEVRKLGEILPLAAAANPWAGLLSFTLYLLIVGLVINGVLSIGEEFGWRAYLLPKLIERFGGAERPNASAAHKAALLIGVIWSVWHWPLFFLGASAGFPYPNLLLYLVTTCSFSVLLSWVTLRSGSVWPASIGHGMINATSALAGYLLKGPARPLLGPGLPGLIGGLGYLVLALVLLFNRRAFAVEKEAGSQEHSTLVLEKTSLV
jgi:membrane protease YdiL (CAAX protease family)